jgi:hypothetical protein
LKILFDQGTPAPLRHELQGHEISTAYEIGVSDLENGDLLRAAEGKFDLLITTDQSLRYQQNLTGRKLAIIVLSTTNWPRIQLNAARVVSAVNAIGAGDYVEVQI